MTVIVCVRHPDHGNEWETFGDDVEIIDVDLGGSIDVTHTTADEYAEFVDGWKPQIEELRVTGEDSAADYIETVLKDNAPEDR